MKYALLDTDFISKTYAVRIDDDNHLIDRVLEMPGYSFVCHEQTEEELYRYNSLAPAWLEKKIKNGNIDRYTDERILSEMSGVFARIAPYQFTNMLRTACDAFDSAYFSEHYADLENLNYTELSIKDYLTKLHTLDSRIGQGKNLGEIKAYVLLQWLSIQYGEQLFYFCSDDKDARNGILAVEDLDVRCITLVSIYQRLHVECSCTEETEKTYIDAVHRFFNESGQENIRVIEAGKVGRFLRVPCEQVLKEIYEDKFEELANGFLKYRN